MPCGLCANCKRLLERTEAPGRAACEVCGEPLPGREPGTGSRCLPCLRRPPPLDRLFAKWSYQAPLDSVIKALKFGNLPYLGGQLGAEVASTLPLDLEVDAVVPVPLHRLRAWRRGYNQAAEIAAALAESRDWPFAALLERRRRTPAQSGLDRSQRRRNLRGAFALRTRRTVLDWTAHFRAGKRVPPRELLCGLRVLLVDDVYTTGSTGEAAARVLKSGGATWVGLAVAGRTPAPGPSSRSPP